MAPEVLQSTAAASGVISAARWQGADPPAWLGMVDSAGLTHAGVMELAVWGFDSV
jgi:hypothetical protein